MRRRCRCTTCCRDSDVSAYACVKPARRLSGVLFVLFVLLQQCTLCKGGCIAADRQKENPDPASRVGKRMQHCVYDFGCWARDRAAEALFMQRHRNRNVTFSIATLTPSIIRLVQLSDSPLAFSCASPPPPPPPVSAPSHDHVSPLQPKATPLVVDQGS